MDIIKKVSEFLIRHNYSNGPLLLSLSGGPDSMALFQVLLELKLSQHIAHIDHGWREESGQEAKTLHRMCQAQGIPFHLKVLKMERSADMEAKAREARRAFYQELLEKHSFEAILLAHHADDQAETVLKRIFEGASLFHFGGMKEVSSVGSMNLWRPFLSIPKKNLIQFLERKEIKYFIDFTNEDPRYLRTRLRNEVIPSLSAHFGKNIPQALQRVADQAQELEQFFRERCTFLEKKTQKTPQGIVWDLGSVEIKTDFEWRGILKHLLAKENVYPTNPTLLQIITHLKQRNLLKKIHIGDKIFICDRGSLFHLTSPDLVTGDFAMELNFLKKNVK